MITVLTVPGIGEALSPDGRPQGMLENLTKHLPTHTFVCRQFNFRNQYGPAPTWNGTAYDQNLGNAVWELSRAIAADPNDVILIGYSAGAQVISVLLEEIHLGGHPDIQISAAVLVANPVQARHEGSTGRYGVAGEHLEWPAEVRIFTLSNPNDIICSSDADSPIRGISNISRTFSFTDPWHWIAGYIEAARTGKNQTWWWNPIRFRAWERALHGGIGYLNQSEHVHWYLADNRFANLAADLVNHVETR